MKTAAGVKAPGSVGGVSIEQILMDENNFL